MAGCSTINASSARVTFCYYHVARYDHQPRISSVTMPPAFPPARGSGKGLLGTLRQLAASVSDERSRWLRGSGAWVLRNARATKCILLAPTSKIANTFVKNTAPRIGMPLPACSVPDVQMVSVPGIGTIRFDPLMKNVSSPISIPESGRLAEQSAE